MTRLSIRARRWLPAAVLTMAAVLPACIVPIAPDAHYYVLNPLPEGSPPRAHLPADAAIVISRIGLPAYLDRPQIVVRSSAEQLYLSEQAHWAGSLREDIERVLARNLSLLLQTPELYVAPYDRDPAPDYRLALNVLHFERDADLQVRLAARWRVTAGPERRPVASGLDELASGPVAGNAALGPTVAAMGRLLGELSGRIADAIAADRARP